MKIALIGATGRIGRHVAQEAVTRGHEVLALVGRPGASVDLPDAVAARLVDIFDSAALAEAVHGRDAIVSAYGAPADALQLLADAATSITAGARHGGVPRVVTVGGAGLLEVAPGVRLADAPDFPAALQPKVLAHANAIAALRSAPELIWTCVVPAARIEQGARTGRYRTAVGALVTDDFGGSTISYADFACALLDELELGRHPRQLLGTGN